MQISAPEYVILSHSPLFTQIKQEEIPALLHCLGAVKTMYQSGSYILEQGMPHRLIGVLLKGQAQIERQSYDGSLEIVSAIAEGDIFAESYACAQIPKLPISVHATTQAAVLWLDFAKITGTCSSSCAFHTQIIRNMLLIVSLKNTQLSEKNNVLAKRKTREKVLTFLSYQMRAQNKNSCTIPFNRQQLADYLAVERSALSAELARMQKDGLILYKRNHFELLEPTL